MSEALLAAALAALAAELAAALAALAAALAASLAAADAPLAALEAELADDAGAPPQPTKANAAANAAVASSANTFLLTMIKSFPFCCLFGLLHYMQKGLMMVITRVFLLAFFYCYCVVYRGMAK